jgi:peptidyl-prolyl cis-trans isomerase D
MGELQKSYSRLYNQYSQMFQGDFDEEKAKSFGLQQQALKQLIDRTLVLNLANEYDLEVNDAELLEEIKKEEFFFKDGSFSKEIYKTQLSRNNLTMNEYEQDLKKRLLIQKVLALLPVETNENESEILSTILSVADKINYKVLDDKQISIDLSDKALKAYWQGMSQNYMTQVTYDINYIKHEKNTSKKDALRTYIDFKKSELSADVKTIEASITQTNNPFNTQTLQEIKNLTLAAPFMKPVEIDGIYYTIELLNVNPAKPKTFENAKNELKPLYVQEQKRLKLQELANNSVATFKGTTTDFFTQTDIAKIKLLNEEEAREFLNQLFVKQNKRGYVEISSQKIVLFNILEQKMLDKTQKVDAISKLKSPIFNNGLINTLRDKYKTEIFIEGL